MNTDIFTGKANNYAKYRPTYSREFIEYLYSDVGFKKESVIADIGSGTGILSELLLERSETVYCIEPNDDMMSIAKNVLENYKGFKPINAPAENTTLVNNSIDFITVAQAFHWFDTDQFKHECIKILKERGKVILIWNRMDMQTDIVLENEKINRELGSNFKGFHNGINPDDNRALGTFFKNGKYERRQFDNDLIFAMDNFIGRNISSSHAPKEGDENYNSYISALKSLFDAYSVDDLLCIKNYTICYIGEVD